jgi:glycosyltransferase involved in cell wall biosynthesis
MEALVKRDDIEQVHFLFVADNPAHNVQANGKLHFWQALRGRVGPATRKIIEEFDIDVFQIHNNLELGTDGLAVAQEMGLPTIYVMHDFWVLCPQLFMIPVWNAMDHEVCHEIGEEKCRKCVGEFAYLESKKDRERINKCDVGVVPSKKHVEIFEKNNVLVGKWVIVEPWVDLSTFHPLNMPKKPMQVAFAGNYIPHKGVQVLLLAWEIVQRRLPNANLIIQGDTRCRARTARLIQNLDLQNVQMVNRMPQEKLNQLYNESSLTVFPSFWEETIGLIWVESLSVGTPVVASATGSIPELLKYGGILVPPRDHVKMAEAIVSLLLSPNRRNKLANEGFNYVRSKFKPERAGQDFANIYYQLQLKGEKDAER